MQRLPVSLCMIVKDEEEHLPRCLKSVEGVVDEIIVVDTGSADNTAEIAESFGARVIRSPWRDDFAHARNAGLAAASGYWVLFLDADEAIDPADREELNICAQHSEYDGFFLQIRNYIGTDDSSVSINPVLRMFRSAPEHRFEGRIHEQIAGSIMRNNPNSLLHLSGVRIHHYGYLNEWIAKKDKANRNLELLLQVLKESPDDPFHLYNIGVEYLRLKQNELALHAFRRSRMLASSKLSFAHLIYKCEARCLQGLRKYEDAAELCAKGLKLYPEYTDLLHAKGIAEMTLGRIRDARISLFAALQQGPPPAGYHTEEGIGTFYTTYALGLLHEAMRDYRPSVNWYLESVRYRPAWAAPLRRLFRFMQCSGAETELAAILECKLRIETPGAASRILGALLESGCRTAVSRLIEPWGAQLAKADRSAAGYAVKLLSGDVEGFRRMLRRRDVSRDRAASLVRERMKGWESWIRGRRRRLALLEQAPPAEWPFAFKIAAACGNAPAALSVAAEWKSRLELPGQWNPLQAQRLARSFVYLADTHLAQIDGSPERQGIVRGARLEAPYEDGC